MPDQKNNTGTAKDTPRTGLAFERPIIELERKIVELQNLSEATGMNLNGELKPLQQKLIRLTREIYENLGAYDVVQIARHPLRPQTSDYIAQMLDEYLELHGDRRFGDDHAITTGFGRIGERRFLLVGHRKGKETKENIACNWGCAHPEGYRKALQKMRLAEKFRLPVLTVMPLDSRSLSTASPLSSRLAAARLLSLPAPWQVEPKLSLIACSVPTSI